SHGLVDKFHDNREANRRIQIAFWNMETKTFDHQRKADHHQETQTQNDHGWMFIDEIHQGFGSPQHNAHRDNHRNHHNRQMINHADCGNNTVEREHGIQHHNLYDDHPEDCMYRIFFFHMRFGFNPLM